MLALLVQSRLCWQRRAAPREVRENEGQGAEDGEGTERGRAVGWEMVRVTVWVGERTGGRGVAQGLRQLP